MDENAKLAEPHEPRQIMYRAIIASALGSARRAEEIGLAPEQIILSCKMSGVQDLISVYRGWRGAATIRSTSASPKPAWYQGTVASTAALAVLLQEGIGDTIRVSLTPQPGEARTQEVVVALEILHIGLRSFNPSVTASRLRPDDEHHLPGARQADRRLPARADAGLEGALSRRRDDEGRGHGLHRQRPGREQARRHRHQPAGHGETPAAPVFIDGERR
jgi:(E)-4-hydroxy-3-methylbut-2-enyl-diphosphate synthase